MTKARNLSDLLDANGDVKETHLDNVPAETKPTVSSAVSYTHLTLPTILRV